MISTDQRPLRRHARGDAALVRVVDSLRTCLRELDLLARWGGDEFVIVLPQSTLGEALDVAALAPGDGATGALRVNAGWTMSYAWCSGRKGKTTMRCWRGAGQGAVPGQGGWQERHCRVTGAGRMNKRPAAPSGAAGQIGLGRFSVRYAGRGPGHAVPLPVPPQR